MASIGDGSVFLQVGRTIFANVYHRALSSDTIRIFVGGKPKFYALHPELVKAKFPGLFRYLESNATGEREGGLIITDLPCEAFDVILEFIYRDRNSICDTDLRQSSKRLVPLIFLF